MKTYNTLGRVVALATMTVVLTAATNVILGTPGPDNLIGTPGDDTINGRGDADTMTGLAGHDTYVVNDEADKVVEQAGGGTDTVRVIGWYELPAYVENLKVAGAQDGGGKGNSLANRMIGNSASNTLNGGPGNDRLTGYAGADDFIFDSPLDANTNVDRLTDFNVAEDSIQLREFPFVFIWFFCLRTGPLPPFFFHIGTSNSSYINYNPVSGALNYAVSGGYVRFATLPPNLALSADNFFVVRSRRVCP
jgi:serralysin